MWFVPFLAHSFLTRAKLAGAFSLGQRKNHHKSTILLRVGRGLSPAIHAMLHDVGFSYHHISDLRHIKKTASHTTAPALLIEWNFYTSHYMNFDPLKDHLPVIAIGSPQDQLNALKWGATIFIPTPLEFPNLAAALKLVVGSDNQCPISIVGDPNGLCIDPVAARVLVRHRELPVSYRHYQILYELLKHKNTVVSFNHLCTKPFGFRAITPRALNVHVCRIRKILETVGYLDCITTISGFGYCLCINNHVDQLNKKRTDSECNA